jgi:hypothetical protein
VRCLALVGYKARVRMSLSWAGVEVIGSADLFVGLSDHFDLVSSDPGKVVGGRNAPQAQKDLGLLPSGYPEAVGPTKAEAVHEEDLDKLPSA